MAKVKMKSFEIACMQSDAKKLVERLQIMGAAELDSFDDSRFSNMPAKSIAAIYERNMQTVMQALSVLDKYSPKKGAGMFSGRTEITLSEFEKKAKENDKTLRDAIEIISLSKKIEDAQAELVKLETSIASLAVWKNLDVPSDLKATQKAAFFIGSFPRLYERETLLKELAAAIPQISEYDAEVIYSSKEITTAFVMCHVSVSQEVLAALRSLGFTAVSETSSLTPARYCEELESKKAQITSGLEECKQRIIAFAEKREKLELLYDAFSVKKDEYEALDNAKVSGRIMVIAGFLPEKNCTAVKTLCNEIGAAAYFAEPDEDADTPVLLKNNKFCEPVEGITEMYALPGKKDIDPSSVMAFFYYLLFGMMLSDAGYGLVMTIGTAVILKKTKVEGSMRKMLNMFFWCGISTVFWGVLFGSWFGDIVPVICKNFLGIENPPSLALWFEPINDPIKLLLFSFVIGICHLFLGLITFGVIQWRDGNKASAIFDTLPIILLVLGAAPLAGNVLVEIPSAITSVAKYVAVAGVVLVVLTSSRTSKNLLVRLGGGLYGLYNVASGYFSDILSYSRLLALGLATGSIASVVNMIGVMPDNKIVKAIMLVVVCLIGHPLNMAINVLGAYVHTNRLQFVELFSKFYEGGGRAFSPLKINTKYFKLKEDHEK